MSAETKEGIVDNPLSTLTKEEVIDTIKSVFKDNEEHLKHLNNIISNLAEIKRLEVKNPGSASFSTWLLPILLLFGPNCDGLDKDLLNRLENESNSKNGESDSMEEGT